jgi:phosphoribosylformimino-5-aminoimidazole carboxamide ribotide isomerase
VFQLIPAIDLQGGRCVRLLRGDFGQSTAYGDDPVAQALAWQAAGAPRLHVVDLDGAREGRPVHMDLVRAIARSLAIPLQVGGGLRTTESVQRALRAGADRVVLGTALLESPRTLDACLRRFGDRVIAGIDARAGMVAVRGWLRDSDTAALSLARRLGERGFVRVVYTDIARDGAMSGPNLDALGEMVRESGLRVIASGGVRSIADLLAVRERGAEAAIVGRALYTGDLALGEALAALSAREPARAH